MKIKPAHFTCFTLTAVAALVLLHKESAKTNPDAVAGTPQSAIYVQETEKGIDLPPRTSARID